MRKLTEKQLDNLSASELAAYFRQEARAEIAEKKQEKANAEKFAAIARPFIEQGTSFDSFMSQTQCPASFRLRYEKLAAEFQKTQVKSPEQVELERLEHEVADVMGVSDPPEQAAEGYQGRPFISSWAQFSQAEKDRERRRFVGGMSTSESPEPEPEEPEEPDDPAPDDPDSEPEQPEQPESPEDDPTEPEHGEPSDNA